MESVLLVTHLIVTIALIGIVLLQRSEGGGLGIGGGGGMGALAGAHTTANVLTRATTILATIFFLTNLSLAYLAKSQTSNSSVIEQVIQGKSIDTQTSPIEKIAEPSDPDAGPKVPADNEPALATDKDKPTAPVETVPAVPSAPIAE